MFVHGIKFTRSTLPTKAIEKHGIKNTYVIILFQEVITVLIEGVVSLVFGISNMLVERLANAKLLDSGLHMSSKFST